MSTQGPERAPTSPLTPLPRLEDLPSAREGYDRDRVRSAFDAFRRHLTQLQAQLRVLQAAQRTAGVEPTGHVFRMDALHLIRAAAEFADTIERDAQSASASQLKSTEEEVRGRQRELQEQEGEIDRYREESERLRAELLNNAKNEARELLARTNAQTAQELREAEARAARLLEQARHQATELTNATRAEVEQTLEWARAQASAVMARAQQGAERLLAAAGLGEEKLGEVVEAIVEATESPSAPAPPEPSQALGRRQPPISPPTAPRAPESPARIRSESAPPRTPLEPRESFDLGAVPSPAGPWTSEPPSAEEESPGPARKDGGGDGR